MNTSVALLLMFTIHMTYSKYYYLTFVYTRGFTLYVMCDWGGLSDPYRSNCTRSSKVWLSCLVSLWNHSLPYINTFNRKKSQECYNFKQKTLTLSLRETISRNTIPRFISEEYPVNLSSRIFPLFLFYYCLIHILSSVDLLLAGFPLKTSVWIRVLTGFVLFPR